MDGETRLTEFGEIVHHECFRAEEIRPSVRLNKDEFVAISRTTRSVGTLIAITRKLVELIHLHMMFGKTCNVTLSPEYSK